MTDLTPAGAPDDTTRTPDIFDGVTAEANYSEDDIRTLDWKEPVSYTHLTLPTK